MNPHSCLLWTVVHTNTGMYNTHAPASARIHTHTHTHTCTNTYRPNTVILTSLTGLSMFIPLKSPFYIDVYNLDKPLSPWGYILSHHKSNGFCDWINQNICSSSSLTCIYIVNTILCPTVFSSTAKTHMDLQTETRHKYKHHMAYLHVDHINNCTSIRNSP